MATKIIECNNSWKPVKVEIEFTSPEQLAVFVQLFGTHQVLPILKQNPHLKDEDVSQLLDQITPNAVWRNLSNILKRHYGDE